MAPQDRLTPDHPGVITDQLLKVEGLSVSYGGNEVVSDVDFDLARGRSLALIGESGSGKSTIARAVLRLLPQGVGRATGRVEFEGRDVLSLPERGFRPLRGRRIGFVPQDPASSLNPVRTIGAQALEAAALLDGDVDRRAAVLEVLAQVGLDEPRRVFDSYPHQLSGGMLQRVLIGLTVLPRPALVVADEPTSALDVTIQKRVLDLLGNLGRELDIGLLLITHDLAVAAERADSLVVLKDGRVRESGPTAEVFDSPSQEYTRRLRADVPALNPDRHADARARAAASAGPPKIEVSGVVKSFGSLRAVDGVSFTVPAGTTHALVGESGSGKTTTIRLLLGLEEPDEGGVRVAGEEVAGRSHASLRALRRHLQLVYQNPFTSLDPTWTVQRLVGESLGRFKVGTRRERELRVLEALRAVGLDEGVRGRRPGTLSGGQRQRVALARSLVLRPDVVVLDEPTSALDVSVQAGIVEVLLELQAELGLTYVFVSHDLALVRQLAHTVSVLHRGRVVEDGPVEAVLGAPEHEYARALVESIPALRSSAGPRTGAP
ncbi:ABC transporter ATP-binding protein [Actinosynnema pretiosum subsp. pretiosum]|uniref:ABC transporter related n=2 Tax=Actinosynnema TaxID=40566 RepID=C6WIT5_ACTMD|nr:ABC transporter ATP-binding protein [Actinosynnema mirum]ACU38175.1 ABC transporter related [Actinosynnema mirum DSM 43827]AXX31680.1 Dipeptide transport ATP-binding protein DppD [Actinosynnema pretiosum subsp. pretiosum]QUF04304.1 ABC transporter ATP-binding protein [Actinosynnema pretiosum subsp. pretiosum]